MKNIAHIILLSCILTLSIRAQGWLNYKLDDVVVTAGRTPATFSDLTRSVIIIDSQEIKEAPVNSVQGLLQYAAGVDIRQRGIDGVQADVSIRGGTSEETLILIDGVKVNDPQTAHHNLNLPVSLSDVQRIEILKGQGSRLYGPNAFSGVINIITKKGYKENLILQGTGGQNGYYDATVSASYPAAVFGNHISLSKQKSNGYRHNTQFDIANFSYSSSVNTAIGSINIFYGYNDKKFGANSFYSDKYPNQWEHTTTKFLNTSGEFGNDHFSISPKLYWRRNDDNYLLDYERPAFYQNIHHTNIYGAEIQSSLITNIGTTSFGGEYIQNNIKSTNLGNHSREQKGFFVEHKFSPVKNLLIVAGGFAYNYSTIGWRFWPGLDAAYKISKNVKLFGSAGKAFRIPTYTELYYSSPASKGNPNLQHEQTVNFEAGLNYTAPAYYTSISLFRKEGKNLIDWVRIGNSDPWNARNISRINTNGIELNFALNVSSLVKDFPIYHVNVSYTYLNSDKKTDQYDSEYLLEYLRHQFVITVNNYWGLNIRQSWAVRYENRINFEDHFLIDTQISLSFSNIEVYIKAANLFNKAYKQISGVLLPGRWITAGAKFNFRG